MSVNFGVKLPIIVGAKYRALNDTFFKQGQIVTLNSFIQDETAVVDQVTIPWNQFSRENFWIQ